MSDDQFSAPRVTAGRLVRHRQLWVGTAVLVGAVTLALAMKTQGGREGSWRGRGPAPLPGRMPAV